jgi:site-specific recombinase XerD
MRPNTADTRQKEKKGECRMNKGKKLPGESYSPEQIKSLLAQFNTRYPCPLRNRALCVVMWRCGLRVSEALDLMPGDVRDGVVKVLNGKGGKARIVALDPQGQAILQAWLDRKAKLGIGGPIFSTLKGTRLSANYVREALPRAAKKAGITQRMHPHGLRHSFACDLAKQGAPLRVISKSLGHGTFATTQVYMDHLLPQEIIDTLKNREW